METATGVLRVEELGTDIAHHIEQFAAREMGCTGLIALPGIGVLHELVSQGDTILHAGFADILVGGVGAGIEILMLFHHMMLPFEPAIEALLLSVSLPHGQQGTQFLHSRHTTNDAHHLFIGRLANAHGLHHFGGDQFFILYAVSAHAG